MKCIDENELSAATRIDPDTAVATRTGMGGQNGSIQYNDREG